MPPGQRAPKDLHTPPDPARPGTHVTFVVPVRNDEAGLSRCLGSIHRQAAPAVRVVVVDNGSLDGSADVARDAGAIVLSAPHAKVGELRNLGATAAGTPLLAFVDADHELDPGWIEAAVETLNTPGVAAVGAPYSPPLSPTWVQRLYDTFRDHTPGTQRTKWLGAGNLAVRADALWHVGGFDTALDPCG